MGDHIDRAFPDDVPRGAFITLAEHCTTKSENIKIIYKYLRLHNRPHARGARLGLQNGLSWSLIFILKITSMVREREREIRRVGKIHKTT